MPKKKTSSRGSAKRELINTGKRKSSKKTKMFGKRTATGRFKEMDNMGPSLSADRRKKAKKRVKSGFGDQGDRKRKASKKR